MKKINKRLIVGIPDDTKEVHHLHPIAYCLKCEFGAKYNKYHFSIPPQVNPHTKIFYDNQIIISGLINYRLGEWYTIAYVITSASSYHVVLEFQPQLVKLIY